MELCIASRLIGSIVGDDEVGGVDHELIDWINGRLKSWSCGMDRELSYLTDCRIGSWTEVVGGVDCELIV